MVYDEGLAHRIVEAWQGPPGTSEKRMFGGWALLWNGNLLAGVIGDDLIARIGPDAYAACLALPGAREFDFTGRPMKGWVTVDAEAVAEDEQLRVWLDRAASYVRTLPAK